MIENQTIDKVNFSETLPDKEYVDCTFINCNLEQLLLKNVIFEECRFELCNLSLVKTTKITWHNVRFTECKEADFSESDLTSAVFDQCEMVRTVFLQTNLEKADFTSSSHFIIDPRVNRLKNAHFSRYGLEGLVAPFGILIDE